MDVVQRGVEIGTTNRCRGGGGARSLKWGKLEGRVGGGWSAVRGKRNCRETRRPNSINPESSPPMFHGGFDGLDKPGQPPPQCSIAAFPVWINPESPPVHVPWRLSRHGLDSGKGRGRRPCSEYALSRMADSRGRLGRAP
jgi:hypothetical protein